MSEMLHLAAVVAVWIAYVVVTRKTVKLLPPFLTTEPGFHPQPGFWWMAGVTIGFFVLTVWVSSSYLIIYW